MGLLRFISKDRLSQVMKIVPQSQYSYANRVARIALKGFEEVLGRKGLNAVLSLAGLDRWIDQFPPDNLDEEFNFADFSAIYQALEEMYGARGGGGLAIRAGRAAFDDILDEFGSQLGTDQLSFKIMPQHEKTKVFLINANAVFGGISDQQASMQETEDGFTLHIHRCPACWGRTGLDRPVCYFIVGMLQEGLKWLSGGQDCYITETQCIAMGDTVCEFRIPKTVS